jgi:hypothetical protein
MSNLDYGKMSSSEIDKLISEKVLERPWKKPTHGSCCTCQKCGYSHDDCTCGCSESIEKAFDIVDRLMGIELVAISIDKDAGGNSHWTVSIDGGDIEHVCTYFSLSKAICIAILMHLE